VLTVHPCGFSKLALERLLLLVVAWLFAKLEKFMLLALVPREMRSLTHTWVLANSAL
jgi:hypothetical protein